ncbi:MAG: two-component system NtrC family sensor kinase [Candidatus Latescibacterota bacterium]
MQLRDLNDHLEERVTERSEQLERAYRDLEHGEKLSAVGRLTAGVVHEVLNPLTVAIGRLDMMKMYAKLTPDHQRNLDISTEQILRGVRILDNLRDFSKQKEPHRESVDLNVLIGDTVELVSYELRKKGLGVIKEFGSLKLIQADLGQLSQVLLNLTSNAIEAMSHGGQLKVLTRLEIEEGQEGVSLFISDTGEGIPEENLSRIFDPFFTSKDDGTGLGLSICLGIVENHGGRIFVGSFVGKGTTFRIWLPLKVDV